MFRLFYTQVDWQLFLVVVFFLNFFVSALVGMSESVERIEIVSSGSENNIIAHFNEEGHTLGNSLRWMVSQDPETKFCSYDTSMDPVKMSLRVITFEKPALTVTDEAMQNLEKMSDHMLQVLNDALEKFNA